MRCSQEMTNKLCADAKSARTEAFESETPASKHLATCGSIGWSGRRCGTTFAYTPRGVLGLYGEPWFRFRNADCERVCREAWALPEPSAGTYFDVADEPDPDVGHSTRVDDRDLLRCPLVRWEGAPFRNSRLHRRGSTDLYRLLQKRPDYFWYPVGRVLRINDAGRALLRALADAERSEVAAPPVSHPPGTPQ